MQVLLQRQYLRLPVQMHRFQSDERPVFDFVHGREERVQIGRRTSVDFEDPLEGVQSVPMDGAAVAPPATWKNVAV